MAARQRMTERWKALRISCWNADEESGKKLELEHYLIHYGVDICLLSETSLKAEQILRLANYISHLTHRLQQGVHSHSSPPWYTPPLTGRSGPHPFEGYRHSKHFDRQTADIPCGLSSTFPPPDRRGPAPLSARNCGSRWLANSTPNTWIGTRG